VKHPKIAILTSVHEPFDPRIFHKQARTLAAAGYRVTLLAPHAADEVVDGVRVWGVPVPRSRAGRPLVWLRLLSRALRLRADVYHFHDPELLPLGLLLARLTGRPVIYDAHEYYRDEIATRPWIPRPLRRLAAETVHAVETAVARRIAAVVAVNEHMAAGFRARGARAVAVHNFPPLAYFDADTEAERRDAPVGAYVGLLTRDRGLATVWEAGRRLRELAPGAEVRVIGRVDWSEVPASVPRDPARWQAETAVRFRGVIPAREVPAALAETLAGWIPFHRTPNNVHTIPLKLLEYMAAGVAVVASDFGFMAEIVREADCGLLVPEDDPEAHARALARLLTRPEEARAMGARGRQAVQERYSWEAESARLLALYADLTHGRG
jgi:glycosyltransferase involved in cell wall biosynthesis